MFRKSVICRAVTLLTTIGCAAMLGCDGQPSATQTSVTETRTRAERRAFYGAPPVIPHQPLGADCVTCHTTIGKVVANQGYAPANPHGDGTTLENCRQCHLFQRSEDQFVDNPFQGLAEVDLHGERLFASAPPTIPHSLLMRSNCLACHSGPSARPEIRCTHPERVNCEQCHVRGQQGEPDWTAAEWTGVLRGVNRQASSR